MSETVPDHCQSVPRRGRLRAASRSESSLRVDQPGGRRPSGPLGVLVLAVWLGLVLGLTELLLVVLRGWLLNAATVGTLQLNRHHAWMIPVSDLGVLAAAGLVLAPTGFSRSRTLRVVVRGVLAGLFCLGLLLTVPGLHPLAALVLAGGLGLRLAWRTVVLEPAIDRLAWRSLPLMLGVLGVLFLLDYHHVTRAEARALAALPAASPGAPNLLLIVLDTVRADHTSPYGYHRDTTPNLARLAAGGVTFRMARAPAPWTLPSHASLFTGRWPHELDVDKEHPLRWEFETIAERLAARGYATGGFVANTYFCNAGYGLAQGFAHYEDYPERDQVSLFELLRNTAIGQRILHLSWQALNTRPGVIGQRKTAAEVNRDTLAWLDARHPGHRDRPFFAFLNYMDAHDPYVTPPGFDRHFGARPETPQELADLQSWHLKDHDSLSERTRSLIVDGYDDCLAYIDEQLGAFLASLEARGLRQNTWIIVTSDHGEQFGEHGLYLHSNSLYRPVIDVPLVLAPPPAAGPSGLVVEPPVSLRDIPATLADLAGNGSKGQRPLPGRSLRRFWTNPDHALSAGADPVLSEVDLAGARKRPRPGRAPASRGPMQAIVADGHTYMHLGDGTEQLYDLASDPAEESDLAGRPESQALRDRFRTALEHTVPADRIGR